ncbi:DNA cytosine methyltransferase, partial [Mycoplasmopsis arginini]|uniref:DNA cytosine methyltransferase n=1 Tax=Mycoplasmopsis arginini TaxID=2094 RepID=UPI00249DEB69
NREKDWGKEKVFREGQAEQVLDTLFFDFIDLANRLQPKIVIAENVKGLLVGEAKEYVRKIYREFDLAGYYVQHWLFDASKMGVPQKRERVFFIAMRKDIATPFLKSIDLFTIAPELNLEFNEPEIPYKEIRQTEGNESAIG